MPDILHRVGIAAEAKRVFDALTTIDGIRGWWCSTATGGAAEGEAFELFPTRHDHLEVLNADPSLVRWRYSGELTEWQATDIRFELEWRDQQTFVVFHQDGYREATPLMSHCSMKWATFLLSLKNLVELGKGQPMPHDVKIEVGG